VYVFISGDVDDEGIKYIIDGLAKIKRGNVKSLAKTKWKSIRERLET